MTRSRVDHRRHVLTLDELIGAALAESDSIVAALKKRMH